ncbi:MAG: hypothetical protein KXJ53_09880 [Phenylobacterium sp.]|jgi:hypothetical protein|nr:hypothetical protein [Phenylobacterium sp.]
MPKTISKRAIERAYRFVADAGRPLDRADLDCVSPRTNASTGSIDSVLTELGRFQTASGGFAHGIEPDLQTPTPQAISTSVGFQYLRRIRAPETSLVVAGGVAWLVENVDRASWVWPTINARVDEGPHAPWWDWRDLRRYRGFVFNVSAELLGYLYDYQTLVPVEVIDGVTKTVVEAVRSTDIIDSPYELLCCMRLHQTRNLPAEVRSAMEQHLPRSLAALDADDVHLDAMGMVPTPHAFGYDILRPHIEAQAERLIKTQAEDGGWHPGWESWAKDRPALREAVGKAWSGWTTREAILRLTRHHFVAS